jgi:endonuclease YncB( thermonuclease family)
MATLAFVLLISALLLFMASTRQWALWMRGAVWGGGLLLLIVAWMLLGSTERDAEIATAFSDLLAKWNRPGESMLVRMLDSNGDTVARIVLSLFDIFLFMALVVGIVALVAFRPGEELENAIRPVMAGIIGAILGGILALTIVGTGFGVRETRQAYSGPALVETVHTAEQLLLNGDLLRLRGIKSYEPGQPCRLGPRVQDCGAEAERGLRRMLDGAYIMCALDKPPGVGAAASANKERLATCTAVRNGGEEFNIARRMVEDGFATNSDATYQGAADAAKAAARGLMAWCAIRPENWTKLTNAKKEEFRKSGRFDRGTPTLGVCGAGVVGKPKGSGFTPVEKAPD